MRKKARRKGPPILRWRGLFAERERRQRLVIFACLAAVVVTMTFVQLGLMHISFGGGDDAYVALTLVPVALAALTLGTAPGFLMGLFAGAVQALHAAVQPLGYYEVIAVTPGLALLVFGSAGLALGLYFALALRREPHGWRRPARIAFVCVLVAIGFSVMFSLSAFLRLLVHLATVYEYTADNFDLEHDILLLFLSFARLGNPLLQAQLDIVVMSLSCIAADQIATSFWHPADQSPLHATFRRWLLLVVTLGFMLVSTVGYVVISNQELQEASENMAGELDYLAKQMSSQIERAELYDKVKEQTADVLSAFDQDALARSYSLESLMDGYESEDDGIILILSGPTYEDVVEATSDASFPASMTLREVLDSQTADAIAGSLASGASIRVVYDPEGYASLDEAQLVDRLAVAEMGYLYAMEAHGHVLACIRSSSMVYAERAGVAMWMSFSAFVLLALVYLLVSRLLYRIVLGPMTELDEGLGDICEGKLDTVVDARGSAEMRNLSNGINTTVGALKGWIGEAERRMEQELVTAKAIQESALPSTFPPFPDIDDFDIYACMQPAKEVGGDFYDFFLVDDDTLGLLIADVSGKGIPGALFMMAAKAQLDNYMQTGMDLAEAVQTANVRLCEGNDAGMFVTAWVATLDFRRGVLTYVNAGHNPPLLRHGGRWSWLKNRSGLFMGTFEKARYKSFEIALSPGDELVLYTDGVNEAFDVHEQEYGNDRLEAFLDEHAQLHPQELVCGLRSSVAAWAEGAEQSDDMTVLALEFGSAPDATGELVVPATVEHLGEVTDFIDAELARRLCPIGTQRRVDLALEELFVNVCNYAYAGADEPGTCAVEYVFTTSPNKIVVSLSDEGVAFDPLEQQGQGYLGLGVDALEEGGLGILLTRRSVDDLSYVREAGRNRVAFSKSW